MNPSQLRQTHTVVMMEISKAAYDEIAAAFRTAGYDHVFMHDGVMDMTGIAVKAKDEPAHSLIRPPVGQPTPDKRPPRSSGEDYTSHLPDSLG